MILFPLRGDLVLTAPPGPAEAATPLEREAAALRPALRALIARLLGQSAGAADVDDATQEALRRVLEGLGNLRPGEPLRPWAFGVARHVALDALRARRRALVRQGEGHDEALVGLVDEAADPEARLEEEQRAVAAQRALAQLPEGVRQALLMFHLEGLSYKDIAARMDLPLGTVATWVTRGRKALAEACQAGRNP